MSELIANLPMMFINVYENQTMYIPVYCDLKICDCCLTYLYVINVTFGSCPLLEFNKDYI